MKKEGTILALSQEQKKKMWALLNETRGQIGLTAYKDYIFGLLFYKYLSEKAQQWLEDALRGDTWENVYTQDSSKALDYMKKSLGMGFSQTISFQIGKKRLKPIGFILDY